VLRVKAPFGCSICKTKHYCSKVHQRLHWPTHKLQCKSSLATIDDTGGGSVEGALAQFPEYLIDVEPEDLRDEVEIANSVMSDCNIWEDAGK
jgi:hypothetical protein